ncbi:hypothetical protein HJG60_008913 [Phyllostomus discolor]|uniref:Uncharacterized protein n=1 Tax=Phyllostomus discolor TaxID=89673 RepID=A0A834DIA1_9CHIR|nr:hypothetical protein HJG60_008913 [Phyllostomus discolor]
MCPGSRMISDAQTPPTGVSTRESCAQQRSLAGSPGLTQTQALQAYLNLPDIPRKNPSHLTCVCVCVCVCVFMGSASTDPTSPGPNIFQTNVPFPPKCTLHSGLRRLHRHCARTDFSLSLFPKQPSVTTVYLALTNTLY